MKRKPANTMLAIQTCWCFNTRAFGVAGSTKLWLVNLPPTKCTPPEEKGFNKAVLRETNGCKALFTVSGGG